MRVPVLVIIEMCTHMAGHLRFPWVDYRVNVKFWSDSIQCSHVTLVRDEDLPFAFQKLQALYQEVLPGTELEQTILSKDGLFV